VTYSFGKFFVPGPTDVRPDVLAAMTQPMIAHRGPEFEALFARIQTGLRAVFRTQRPVYVSTSSATGLMEAAIRCAPEGRILALVNGGFSERFAKIARMCGRECDEYKVPVGSAHEPGVLSRLLSIRQYAAITVVHSETSTGVLNDVRALSDAAHERGALCLIDSVSGLGGAPLEFDEWKCDYVLTGSQKALALPPGLAFAAASVDFVEGAFGLARVAVLDDARDGAVFANDPAVAGRVGEARGEHGRCGARGAVFLDERRDRRPAQERDVAREQQHVAVRVAEHRFGLQQRVAGADLRVLRHEPAAAPAHCRLHRVGLMADHDGHRRRAGRAGGVEDVVEQGPSGELVQHLGPLGFHPCALAGGQNHDVERAHL